MWSMGLRFGIWGGGFRVSGHGAYFGFGFKER